MELFLIFILVIIVLVAALLIMKNLLNESKALVSVLQLELKESMLLNKNLDDYIKKGAALDKKTRDKIDEISKIDNVDDVVNSLNIVHNSRKRPY